MGIKINPWPHTSHCVQDDSNSVSVSVDPSGLNVQIYKNKWKPISLWLWKKNKNWSTVLKCHISILFRSLFKEWIDCNICKESKSEIDIYEQKTEVYVVEVTNKTQPTEFEE